MTLSIDWRSRQYYGYSESLWPPMGAMRGEKRILLHTYPYDIPLKKRCYLCRDGEYTAWVGSTRSWQRDGRLQFVMLTGGSRHDDRLGCLYKEPVTR